MFLILVQYAVNHEIWQKTFGDKQQSANTEQAAVPRRIPERCPTSLHGSGLWQNSHSRSSIKWNKWENKKSDFGGWSSGFWAPWHSCLLPGDSCLYCMSAPPVCLIMWRCIKQYGIGHLKDCNFSFQWLSMAMSWSTTDQEEPRTPHETTEGTLSMLVGYSKNQCNNYNSWR